MPSTQRVLHCKHGGEHSREALCAVLMMRRRRRGRNQQGNQQSGAGYTAGFQQGMTAGKRRVVPGSLPGHPQTADL